ncbi:MAG TPA: Co2+/Mg2+ efflux protein ApaG [Myxococcales bacterium]|nr:Co2+/Mg2+ efflux protein ApaG [Myxococcales bacterium]HAN31085.1 Co2+/Mg2+ efflux protein ApaG [Myxococcales bacterium]
MSEATTRDIRVIVQSQYLPAQSDPPHCWFFVYQVTIDNLSQDPVQLLSREWVITDGEGHTERVRGPGVVGQQPRIDPGETFQYVSGCPLSTPIGTMGGNYTMRLDNGDTFAATIGTFVLKDPMSMN